MATLQNLIAKKFFDELMNSDEVDEEKVAQIRKLLALSKRPKADDFVKIFSQPAGDDLK